MSDFAWQYNESEWVRTRFVEIAHVLADGEEAQADEDGKYRWIRHRTGPQKIGRAASSEPFTKLVWCYRSAVKENWPLHVPVPAGLEGIDVEIADSQDEIPPEPPAPAPEAKGKAKKK